MGKIVAIGGVTPPLNLDKIDEEIIRLTGKKNPKVLYVPTAGGDDLGYCEMFKGIYEGKFGCQFDVLFLVRETPNENVIREKIFSSDIIYIEGGSQSRLINTFRKFKVDKALEEAYNSDIVFAGKSAGAICWGKYYFECEETEDFLIDGYDDYKEVECLGFLKYIICPHYSMSGYKEKHNATLKFHNFVGIGIDNDCAVQFIDDTYRVISSRDEANAYKVYRIGNEIKSEIIVKDLNFRSQDELLNI
jgi:dipeptidase E